MRKNVTIFNRIVFIWHDYYLYNGLLTALFKKYCIKIIFLIN